MYQFPLIKLLSGSHSTTKETGQGCFMNVIAYLNNEPVITAKSECVCFIVRPIAIWLNDYCDDVQRSRLLPFILRAMGSRTNDVNELSRRVNLVVAFADTQKTLAAKSAAESAAKYAEFAKSADKLAAKFAARSAAKYAAKYAAESAKYAGYTAEYAKSAAKYAESAEYAAESAAKYAAESAESAAESAGYAAESAESAEYAAKYAAESAESAEYAAKYAAESAEYAAKYAAKYAAESAEYAAKYAAVREQIIQAGIDFLDAALPPLEKLDERIIERIAALKELNKATV